MPFIFLSLFFFPSAKIFAFSLKNHATQNSLSSNLDQEVLVVAKQDATNSFTEEVVNHFSIKAKSQIFYLGSDFEIMQAVFDSLKIKHTFKIVPEQDLELMLLDGTADIALGIQKTKETEEIADFPIIPLRTIKYFFYGRQLDVKKSIMTYKDVLEHNFNVGTITGTLYPEEFWQTFPFENRVLNSHLIESHDYEESIKKLKSKKIDLFVGNKNLAEKAINKLEANEIIYQYKNILFFKDFYCAFSKKSKLKNKEIILHNIEKYLYKMQESNKLKKINSYWIRNAAKP